MPIAQQYQCNLYIAEKYIYLATDSVADNVGLSWFRLIAVAS